MPSSPLRLVVLLASLAALSLTSTARAYGGHRNGGGDGGASDATSATPPVNLAAQEAADLQYLREVEKLARDVYATLYERWGLAIFSKISQSEQRHTDAIRALIEKYGIEDPAASTPPGLFVSGELQQLHDSLVKAGLASSAAALDVGVLIEETDIADLQRAMALTTRDDISNVYGNLLYGSNHHLDAFTQWSR